MASSTEQPSVASVFAAKKKQQGRSPAYPSVTLSIALAKAQALYNQEGKYPAPMAQALKAWGYSEKSSGGRLLRAAMRYYGLITVEGESDTGTVKLTADAMSYLLDSREDQTEKKLLIRKLALNPAIHRKLVAKYPEGIISEGNAKHYLVFTEGFNPSAADELIGQFKGTAAFAEIFKPDTVKGNEGGADGRTTEDLEQEMGSEDKPPENPARVLPPAPPGQTAKVKMMEGERVVFTEENSPQVYLKLVASGELDEMLLEALEDYVKRQRKRLSATVLKQDPTDPAG